MTALRLAVADGLLVLGVALVALAALGLLRLPDAYLRANAVAKAASLGVVCVLLGVLLHLPRPGTAVLVLAACGFQLFTAPVAGYAVARAAHRSGVPRHGPPRPDDLAP
ncbi:monovalent cation/H(+) antiporter subunit G [Streptomyces sp. YIM 98790]|uniref:monovalent cation/H(+) antiporter subunit G n=1 Tax=Streptomyces sp. YIM 98790 TaxID=2689077 RepID=UPI001A9FC0A5|nr:monovalent cation/H(+) antiporter subunit G [Streptomyces sp. YIM 98790]